MSNYFCFSAKMGAKKHSGTTNWRRGRFSSRATLDPILTEGMDPDPILTEGMDPDPIFTEGMDPDPILTEGSYPDTPF